MSARVRDVEPDSNAWALENTLEQLRVMGRLEPVDAAKIQATRALAAAVDVDPHNASLWRQYREALEALTDGAGRDNGPDPVAEALRAAMGNSAPA